MMGTTSLPFDCDHGLAHWATAWSAGKKAWCCMRAQRGCPTSHDCDDGDVSEWSADKRDWCCEHSKLGCARETPPATTPSTMLPATKAVPLPAAEPAAPPSSTTTAYPMYDCEAGFMTWHLSWSTHKQDWCCKHAARGCPDTPGPSGSFDCKQDFDKWLTMWDKAKREWCCKHNPDLGGHAMCFAAQRKFLQGRRPGPAAPQPRIVVPAAAMSLAAAAATAALVWRAASSRRRRLGPGVEEAVVERRSLYCVGGLE